jgi:phage host-nuclease inhibitor protein Gam
MNFLDEILAQAEVAETDRRMEMNKQQANHILAAIAVLEQKQAEVESLVAEEMRLLTEYREGELQRLQKKIRWLAWNLEQFMREHNAATQEKTLNLPKGVLKLRQMKGSVDIIDIDLFMKAGPKLGLIRSIPERFEPDLPSILKRITTTGEVPPGVSYEEGKVKFTFSTNGGINGK